MAGRDFSEAVWRFHRLLRTSALMEMKTVWHPIGV